MHFLTIVAIPPGYTGDVGDYCIKALQPFEEDAPDSLYDLWDWWQLGGRWSGTLEAGYDPRRDPRNWETCLICGGTGQRTDGVTPAVHDGKPYCNGCTGDLEYTRQPGIAVKYPTQWATERGNIARYGDVREMLQADPPFALITEGLNLSERHNPNWKDGDDFDSYFLKTTEVTDALATLSDDAIVVVVDCHI